MSAQNVMHTLLHNKRYYSTEVPYLVVLDLTHLSSILVVLCLKLAEWDMYEVLGECLDRNSVFKSYIRANWNKYVTYETELYYNMG